MLTKDMLLKLLRDVESPRVERTISTGDTDKFCETVCAFANDMPDSKQDGYLLVGAFDDGKLSMHCDYHSTGPTMFYQYADRIEILNSGGLYGRVNRDNFPDENDYRNPIIADAMRTLGYVNRFGRGIGRVKAELIDNGNGEPLFDTAQIGSFRVSVGLTKFAKEAGSAAFPVESSQKSAGSTQTTAERDESRRKSNESVAESNETGNKSRESILSWASNVLPGTIRADARGNMIKILLEIGLDPKTTTDKMKSSVGIFESGVHKILVSLKKMGLVSRVGADFGGHWELVGFEP